MSTIVAGVDFGTLSVRLSLFDSERGRLGFATAEYPLKRKKEDPDFATQSHADQMEALALASRKALQSSGVNGNDVAAIALDTTGSSVIPVGEGFQPAQRLLSLVRSPRVERSCQNHRSCAQQKFAGHRLVRRRLFFGVGFRKTSTLVAQQSGKAKSFRNGI